MIGHFHEQGSVLAGTASGYCDGFEVEVEIESDEQPDVITTLIRLARQMCFTEQALTGKMSVTVTSRVNGKSLEI